MNKIIKKLHIPGYKTIIVTKPKKTKANKHEDGGFQMSLDIGKKPRKTGKTSNV